MATEEYQPQQEPNHQPPAHQVLQQVEVETQPRQLPPKKSSKGVTKKEVMISLVIVGILLVFLFAPFIPRSDYTVLTEYAEYITSGSTTWPEIGWVKTECVVVIKDGGVGGRYEVTFYAGYGERTASRQIDAGATEDI